MIGSIEEREMHILDVIGPRDAGLLMVRDPINNSPPFPSFAGTVIYSVERVYVCFGTSNREHGRRQPTISSRFHDHLWP